MPVECQDLILSYVNNAFLDDKGLRVNASMTKEHQVQLQNHKCSIACLL